jgi:hypothetical protein
VLVLPSSVVYASTPNASDQQGVLVPVIFDGTYYQPAEFNIIQQQLQAQGVHLYSTMDNGILYAFSSLKDFCKKYSVQFDVSNETVNQNELQKNNQIIPLSIDPGFAYNWIYINQGGNCSAIQEGNSPGNFSGQFVNSISSVYYASGGSTYWVAYAICDQYDQGGNWLIVLKGAGNNDLRNVSFNDKAKSYVFGHS